MTTYSGSDSFDASFTIPDDAALPTAAQVNPGLEANANRSKYLYNRLKPLLQGVSAIQIIPNFWSRTNNLASQASTSSTGFNLLYADMIGPMTNILAGDFAITLVTFSVRLTFTGGSPTDVGAEFKMQDSQNGATFADLAYPQRIEGLVQTSGQEVRVVTLLGFRAITTPGTYEVDLLGGVVATSASQRATIIGNGGGYDTGLDAFTLIMRPTPNP